MLKKVLGVLLVMVAVCSLNECVYAIDTVEVDQEEYSYADQLDDEAYARELEAKQASPIDQRRKVLSEKMATIDVNTKEGKKAAEEISKEMMVLASMRSSALNLIIDADDSVSFNDYIDAVKTYGVTAKIFTTSEVKKNDIIDGDYPLHAAIKSGRCDEAIYMVENFGADPNQVNDLGQTPLMLTMICCKGRAMDVATCLINNGATVTLENVDVNGVNAMFCAVVGLFAKSFTLKQSGWMIDFLVNNGANINAIGPNKMNLLMYTMHLGSKCNRMEDAEILIMNLIKRFPQLDISYAIERNGRKQKLLEFAIAYGYGDKQFLLAITSGVVNF